MAGFLGVITRLRNPLLASLRDSPKPRPLKFDPSRVLGKRPLSEAKEEALKAKERMSEPIYYLLSTK